MSGGRSRHQTAQLAVTEASFKSKTTHRHLAVIHRSTANRAPNPVKEPEFLTTCRPPIRGRNCAPDQGKQGVPANQGRDLFSALERDLFSADNPDLSVNQGATSSARITLRATSYAWITPGAATSSAQPGDPCLRACPTVSTAAATVMA